MGPRVLVDAHVQVDPRITVSEGHRVAESARARLLGNRADIQDVLVHVDVEDDLMPPRGGRLPRRGELVEMVAEMLGDGAPAPQRVQLHYLDGGVEVEVFVAADWLAASGRKEALVERVNRILAGQERLRAIRIYGLAHEWCH